MNGICGPIYNTLDKIIQNLHRKNTNYETIVLHNKQKNCVIIVPILAVVNIEQH